jgi:hypothetical protein
MRPASELLNATLTLLVGVTVLAVLATLAVAVAVAVRLAGRVEVGLTRVAGAGALARVIALSGRVEEVVVG